MYEDVMIHFCSDRCKDRFIANPKRFAGANAAPEGMKHEEPISAEIPNESTGSEWNDCRPHHSGSASSGGWERLLVLQYRLRHYL
jgi:hypothetical protein